MKGGLINLVATIGILFGPTLIAWRSLSKGGSRYGFALMLSISIVYILSGLFGISLGHDILDHFFIYMMAASTYLVFATRSRDVK